jgi:hypothetical protein
LVTRDKNIAFRDIPETKLPASPFRFYYYGNLLGLISGLLMGVFLVLLEVLGAGSNEGLKMVKYVFMGGLLFYGLSSYKKSLPDGKIFKNGILLGLYTSFIAAISLLLFSVIITGFSGGEIAFSKFTMDASSGFSQMITLEIVLLFEVIVFGMILTFISLQYLKDGTPTE